MPPDHGGDADLAADELQSLSFGSSERSRSGSTVSTATTVSTTTSGPPPPPPPPPPRAAAAPRLGAVSLSDIRFVRRLGSGDIGSVYLAEVKGARGGGAAVVAAKVMDRKELAGRNKEGRARTEREILEAVDHPFLPRLYGVAEGDRWSCLLTEFCPGGDLHVLRQRQPHRRFTESAVRFYAAEVVAALEYIHMMDIVYRDLKPENVLVRADGHIMLTDFDLSLKCDPTAPTPAHVISDPIALAGGHYSASSSCIIPSCIVPAVSCFQLFPGRGRRRRHRRKKKTASGGGGGISGSSFPAGGLELEFVAEPVELRSMSFVGTHEYLAPEIVSGEGHGSSVDWWTLGVFVFELLYGVTPFKGYDNEMTLANIVARALEFPRDPPVSSAAKDLVTSLLAKDPTRRLGATVGAAAIKRHPFFSGVNWALLRCATPPYVPPPFSVAAATAAANSLAAAAAADMSDDDSCPGTPVEYY
uniref:non-specific serine/threonine protein kinase n=1 Tax=Oryza glumipatula TaxID=40148 RepID=A0A0E0BNZ6_9ORYZ